MNNTNYLSLSFDLLYRNVTAGKRILPQVYVLGAPKCGTTALYEILCQHPNFLPPFFNVKELNYLQDIPNYVPYDYRGILKVLFNSLFGTYTDAKSYRKFFPLIAEVNKLKRDTNANVVSGDFSPIYLYSDVAAKRIKAITPEAKLIIMLRNPVKRAYSEYNMFFERTPFENRSFEQAIEDESNNVSLNHYVIESYIKRGIYEPYIKTYLDLFDKKQVMIIKSEDFFTQTPKVVEEVLNFVELPINTFNLNELYYRNETSYNNQIKPETCQELVTYYKPYNSKLSNYLDMDFEWS